jgi:hypothetical protein
MADSHDDHHDDKESHHEEKTTLAHTEHTDTKPRDGHDQPDGKKHDSKPPKSGKGSKDISNEKSKGPKGLKPHHRVLIMGGVTLVIIGIILSVFVVYIIDGVGSIAPEPSSSSPASSPSVSARSADCPGVAKLMKFDQNVTEINPTGCDLSFREIVGKLDLLGPQGGFQADSSKRGRTGTKVITKVRANAQYETAQAYIMLCLPGKGPDDGSWSCKP